MSNIIPFPKSTDLSTWLEEHVAEPSGLDQKSRLLVIGSYSIPYPDLNPRGMLVFQSEGIGWRTTGRTKRPVQLPTKWRRCLYCRSSTGRNGSGSRRRGDPRTVALGGLSP
ncbi:MAG TPA: hypothetical protein VER98_05620 [Terriglobia bacterium]|nr:hypothetical protein [Terriglobia bacterium]